MLVSAGSLQAAPLKGRTEATVCQLEGDEAAGVLEEDLDRDRSPGEEDQRPEDHRGGAGAGSPEENNSCVPPVVSPLLVPPQARDRVQSQINLQTNFWSRDTFRPLLL